MSQRFFIIDGFSQIFRCYYAPFRVLNAPSGEPTRATFVFTQMLLQLIREHHPDYLAMVMDSGHETVFRRAIDPAYKANREPPPEDLVPQIERIGQIVAAQKIPVLAVEGFEADDIIATICRRLADQDIDIVVVSRDKDLDQLLSDRVRLFDPGKGEFIGPAELQAAKGYPPCKAIEVQTLSGDPTDNVPGVRGVGPKKAAALIAKYGTAAGVLAHANELSPAMRANVLAFADSLERTRQLVTLRQDVPLDFDLQRCRWHAVDWSAWKPIFEELGFQRLLEQAMAAPSPEVRLPRIPPAAPESDPPDAKSGAAPPAGESEIAPPAGRPEPGPAASLFDMSPPGGLFDQSPGAPAVVSPPGRTYVLVDDAEKFRAFLADLRRQEVFALDTETTSLQAVDARLCGLSFSWRANTGYYLPVRGVGRCLPLEDTLEALRPVLADPSIRKIGQNIKYDMVVLASHGAPVRGVWFDTMIASFVLDSSRPSHGMDALARELLGITPIPISDLIGRGRDQVSFDAVDTARACTYAAEDADVTWQLAEVLGRQLDGSGLERLFAETEMPLVEVLADMECEGVRLDPQVLARMSRDLQERLDALTREIHAAAGRPFNIDSPRQLATVLFDELRLPAGRRTKTGLSTDAETLAALAWETQHPVPRLVLEYREVSKLKGTYVDTLPKMISPRTGRIHASFHQTGAVTGRLSSSDPNLQNIPIRTELGRRIREAFVPRDADHVLLTADYSQIELRVLAHFCGDEALRAAFASDRDIHQFVASQVFGVPPDQVTREQRSRAKAVNFGIIYGQTAYGLSRGTGMSVGEAQAFIDMYFMRYPGIRMFIDRTVAEARRRGLVETILGRRRAIPEINSRNSSARAQAERLAVNTVIQGSAADLIKRAMIGIHRRIRAEGRPSRMIIQVHDELVFDVPRAVVEAEAAFIRQEMCTALPLDVPIKVDINWGSNWLEGK